MSVFLPQFSGIFMFGSLLQTEAKSTAIKKMVRAVEAVEDGKYWKFAKYFTFLVSVTLYVYSICVRTRSVLQLGDCSQVYDCDCEALNCFQLFAVCDDWATNKCANCPAVWRDIICPKTCGGTC